MAEIECQVGRMTLPIGRRPIKKGYTLIELVLLTIIIAILVAVSTPLFRKTFASLELKDTSFNVAKLIGFAQEKAIIERTPYKLIIDKDKSSFQLRRQSPDDSRKYVKIKEKYGRRFTLPRGLRFKKDNEIIFYPDGRSDRAIITILGKTKSLKINVKGSLGYVEIEEKKK